MSLFALKYSHYCDSDSFRIVCKLKVPYRSHLFCCCIQFTAPTQPGFDLLTSKKQISNSFNCQSIDYIFVISPIEQLNEKQFHPCRETQESLSLTKKLFQTPCAGIQTARCSKQRAVFLMFSHQGWTPNSAQKSSLPSANR